MKQRIKLGDKVKLVKDIKQHTIVGDELFLKGTIGIVCDDDNPNCPIVEINNSNGKHTISGFNINDLEII